MPVDYKPRIRDYLESLEEKITWKDELHKVLDRFWQFFPEGYDFSRKDFLATLVIYGDSLTEHKKMMKGILDKLPKMTDEKDKERAKIRSPFVREWTAHDYAFFWLKHHFPEISDQLK